MKSFYYLDVILFIPFLFLLHSILGCFVSLKTQRYLGFTFLVFSIFISFIFVGFRGEYGTDYENYAPMFNGNAASNHAGLLLESLINISLFLFSEDYSSGIIFFLIWMAYIFLSYLVARSFKSYFYHVFLYLHCMLLPSNMLGSLRQGIAVLAMTLALIYVIKNKNLKALFVTSIGATMHFGSVALLPVIALVSKQRVFIICSLFVLSFAVYFLQVDIIERKLAVYSALEGYSGGGMGSLIGKLIFAPFLFLTFTRFNLKSFISVFLFLSALITPFALSAFPIIAERIGIFFECYKLFIILWLIENSKLKILQLFLFLVAVSTFFKFYTHTTNWGDYFPFYVFSIFRM